MNAWSEEEVMGPTVNSATSGKASTPPLKNGKELRESGYLISVGSRTSRLKRKQWPKYLLMVVVIVYIVSFFLSIVMSVLYINLIHKKYQGVCHSTECLRSAANLALSMDKTADPCEDFYKFVCGNWAEDHLPATSDSFNWFQLKQGRIYNAVREVLTKNMTDQPRPVQQAKDMYTACMDTETLDKRGLKPVYKMLELLGLPAYPTYVNVTDNFDYSSFKFDWLDVVIKIKIYLGMDVLIGFDIIMDPKNSSIYRMIMGSPDTTNPFPSMNGNKGRKMEPFEKYQSNFYLNKVLKSESKSRKNDTHDKDAGTTQIYKLFYADLINIFVLEADEINNSNLSKSELEHNILIAASEYYNIDSDMHEISQISNDTEFSEEFTLNIPEYTVDEIQTHTNMIVELNNATAIPIWKRYLEGIFNITDDVTLDFNKDKILVTDPDLKYMALMAAFVSKIPPVIIELYIWMKVTEVMAIHTTTEMRSLFHNAYEHLHVGETKVLPPLSVECACTVDDMLGMAVSYAIADPHFITVTKPKIHTMLNDIKNALARLVGKAKWMDDDTKLATYQKIIELKTLIGFPDWLLEKGELEKYYKGIEINTESHMENMINIIQLKMKNTLNTFREGNHFTWTTNPTEVNAFHSFQENTITVPLAMLQYPFFDLGLDSLNYGSLGAVLGHEITHGFDNFGRRFDKNGNWLPWWKNETIRSFENMTQCLIDQYSSYYIKDLGVYVNGKKTLGENIADNGGVREALMALKEHLKKFGPELKLPGFEGLSSEQLFFLSYGNAWCSVSTLSSQLNDLEDVHSPQQFRVLGPLQNSEEFSRVWKCPSGSPMNPTKKCIIF